MGYTTQMNAARQKIVTKEMQAVAAWEGIGMDRLLKLVANGQAVIPANKNHKCLKPFGIGSALKTKINVNLGTSRDCMNMDVELEKVMNAGETGEILTGIVTEVIKGGVLVKSGVTEELVGDSTLENVFLELEGEGS